MDSVVMSINDILDELMSENKRLFNELLFANNCFNELKTHLINIHSKYQTIIDCEDSKRWDQLNDKTSGRPTSPDGTSEELANKLDIKSNNCWQLLNKSCDENDVELKRPSNGKQLRQKRYQKQKKNINKNKKCYKVLSEGSEDESDKQINILDTNKTLKKVKTKIIETLNSLLITKRDERDKCYDLKEKSYICPIDECHKKCQSDRQFQNHLRWSHGVEEFGCEVCGKVYRQSCTLKKHSLKHSEDKPFKCDYNGCRYETHISKSLERHLALTHSTSKPVVCDVDGCGKTFKNEFYMKIHSQRHDGQPIYKCGINRCIEVFFTDHQRRKHQTQVHNRLPPKVRKYEYKCDWPGCEWTGRWMSKHKRGHIGHKPHLCEWPDCGKQFTTACRLKDHMNIHNNVKPYGCHWPGCQYRSANKCNINKHIRETHKQNNL